MPATQTTGPKPIAVRNLRTTKKSDPEAFVQKTKSQLEDAITAIFQNKRPAQSNEELYKGVENLCRLGKAEEVSKNLSKRSKDHITNSLKTPLLDKADAKNVEVLEAVIAAWRQWMSQVVSHTSPIQFPYQHLLTSDRSDHAAFHLLLP